MANKDGIIDELDMYVTREVLDGRRTTEVERELRAVGYVPVLRWTKVNTGHSVTCTTGEAVANVKAETERLRKSGSYGR